MGRPHCTIHTRDHASLSMCDGSGDGKKWKLERCLGGHITGVGERLDLEEGYKDSQMGAYVPGLASWGSGAFNGAHDFLPTDVPQSGLVRVSHMCVD